MLGSLPPSAARLSKHGLVTQPPCCPAAAEVNAPGTWKSWGLIGTDGKFKYPDFPPVAFIMMEASVEPSHRCAGVAAHVWLLMCCAARVGSGGHSTPRSRLQPPPSPTPCRTLPHLQRDDGPGSTDDLIRQRIADLRNYSVPADYLLVRGGVWDSLLGRSLAAVPALVGLLGEAAMAGRLSQDP